MRSLHRLIACLLIFGLSPAAAFAAEALPLQAGRIGLAEAGAELGTGVDAWSGARVNEPFIGGWSLRSGDQGRAEIRLHGIAVALMPASEITLVRLDDTLVRIMLARGRIGLRLDRRAGKRKVEIDTAHGAIVPLGPGQYDITAGDPGQPAHVGVFAGDVDTDGDAASGPGVADDFSDWWRALGDDDATASLPDAALAAIPGAAALAGYGDWGNSEYGAIWYPKRVPDGWVPFRYGLWRWLPPWGWTWVDDAPWGFAPSHYGRWARVDRRWGWVPGNSDRAPAYVPAAVMFLGTPGIGLSYAGGSGPAEAWFPLGPGEAYWPPGKPDIAAIRDINAAAVADPSALAPGPDGGPPAAIVNGDYRYRRFASAVPRGVFVGGKPVDASLVAIPEQRLAVAPLVAGGPQIPPAAPRPPAPKVAAAPLVVPLRPVATARPVPGRRIAAAHRPLRTAVAGDPLRRARLDRVPIRTARAAVRPARHHARKPPSLVVRLGNVPPHGLRRRHFAAARHVIRQ